MIDLDGKNILLTGDKGFLGNNLKNKLLQEFGCNVVGVDLNVFDITDPNATEQYFNSIDLEFDGVINNAAVSFKGKNISNKKFLETLNVNIFGTYNVMKHVLPKIKKGGSVVNISSVYSFAIPKYSMYDGNEEQYNNISYGASKAAVNQMTKIMAVQMAPDIRVNAVSPGGIRGDQNIEFVKKYSQNVPLQRMVEVDEVIGCIVFLLSDMSSGITGQNIYVDGGLGIV